MKNFDLTVAEFEWIADAIEEAHRTNQPLRLAYDPIDEGIKVRDVRHRWSPSLGNLVIDD